MSRLPVFRDWRLFEPILAGGSLRDRIVACIGAVIGIVVTGFACSYWSAEHQLPLLVAPIGATAVLLFAVPASPLAQPWPVIGGNVVSALIGVAVGHLGLPTVVTAGLAVGTAILVMSLLRCLHPPGGAAALTAVIGGPAVHAAGWMFPLIPIAVNSVAIVAVGFAYHRFSGHSYPHRAVPLSGHVVPAEPTAAYRRDLDAALEDLGETFDVSREDLELLFGRMEFHHKQRA